jgi:hypothetical protein
LCFIYYKRAVTAGLPETLGTALIVASLLCTGFLQAYIWNQDLGWQPHKFVAEFQHFETFSVTIVRAFFPEKVPKDWTSSRNVYADHPRRLWRHEHFKSYRACESCATPFNFVNKLAFSRNLASQLLQT